jgi:ABC-2 type transport system ATP-binding protein
MVTVTTNDAAGVERLLRDELRLDAQRVHQQFRMQTDSPAALVSVLAEKLGDRAQSIAIGRPSLEDVFIAKTGHEFAAKHP